MRSNRTLRTSSVHTASVNCSTINLLGVPMTAMNFGNTLIGAGAMPIQGLAVVLVA
ncbi:MAG: hypothetical protein KBD65_00960 [Candidatus Moranbacteria bacterium]|nr:hypothetical protein [Candidatus Moranbacteria bacterium]